MANEYINYLKKRCCDSESRSRYWRRVAVMSLSVNGWFIGMAVGLAIFFL